MPHILAITPYPYTSADTRYRFSQFIPALQKAGWDVTVRPFMDERLFAIYNLRGHLVERIFRTLGATLRRLLDLVGSSKFDVVFLHKEAFPFGPPIMERILHHRTHCIIYDMDDAFWSHPPQFKQIGARFRDPHRIEKIIALSELILAGNNFLADYARSYNPSVIVFPTVVDTERFYLREEQADSFVTIGWIGRWSSSAYLNLLLPVFKRLAGQYPQVRWLFIGADGSIPPAEYQYEIAPWRIETEVNSIAKFDIGIMPLPDDAYSQGKCGLKLLQYMAMGVPGVASPVGVNQEIIQDGVNGFLASTEDEWFHRLSCLIEDGALRKSIGIAGRVTVEQYYSLKIATPVLLRVLNKILES